jgi:hypothetical protein
MVAVVILCYHFIPTSPYFICSRNCFINSPLLLLFLFRISHLLILLGLQGAMPRCQRQQSAETFEWNTTNFISCPPFHNNLPGYEYDYYSYSPHHFRPVLVVVMTMLSISSIEMGLHHTNHEYYTWYHVFIIEWIDITI